MGIRSVSGHYSKVGVSMLIITQKRGGRIVSGCYSKQRGGLPVFLEVIQRGWGFAVFLEVIQKWVLQR